MRFTLTLALSRGARVSFPMMDNFFVGDGVPYVPNWLAKNQDNFPITDNFFVGDGLLDVPYWLAKNHDNFPIIDNSVVGDGVLAKHAESTRRRRPENGLQKIKIILPMICFHICAIYPHPPLSRGARVSFPMMDNSVVGDGVLAKHAESTRRRRPVLACKKSR